MSQERQLQLVTSVMISAGFEVSEKFTLRPRSFDLIARNNGTLLVIKVVVHIDSVSEEAAFDLDVIAEHLGGVPLIVGERAREAELERGAVYVRYGIYAISVATLYDYFVEKIPPLVYASPGGLYVNINGDALRDLRERCSMSLGDLGQVLGVSRRTISKYESGMGTTLDVAIRIEEYFNTGVVESIDIIRGEPAGSGPEEPKKRQGPGIPIDFLEQLGMHSTRSGAHRSRRSSRLTSTRSLPATARRKRSSSVPHSSATSRRSQRSTRCVSLPITISRKRSGERLLSARIVSII